MPLMPKRVKFRKSQRGNVRGEATRCNYVAMGDFGLQALERAWITAEQIEAGRMAIGHFLKDEGKMVIRIFPHKSTTAKPAETRMGTGKGEVAHWVAIVKPGTIMFELGGVPEELAREALARVARKLPIRTRMITRRVKL